MTELLTEFNKLLAESKAEKSRVATAPALFVPIENPGENSYGVSLPTIEDGYGAGAGARVGALRAVEDGYGVGARPGELGRVDTVAVALRFRLFAYHLISLYLTCLIEY